MKHGISEDILALGFVFITLGYIVVIRFVMSKIQDEINNIKLGKREYTFDVLELFYLKE